MKEYGKAINIDEETSYDLMLDPCLAIKCVLHHNKQTTKKSKLITGYQSEAKFR